MKFMFPTILLVLLAVASSADFNPALLSSLTGTIQPSVRPREQELEAYNRKRVVKILNNHLGIIGTGLLISSNALLTATLLAENAYYMKLQRMFGINLYTFKRSYPEGLYIKVAMFEPRVSLDEFPARPHHFCPFIYNIEAKSIGWLTNGTMTTAKFKFMDASSFVLEGQLLYDNFRYEPRLGDVLIQDGEVVGLLTSTYNIGAEMFAYYGFPFSN